MSASIAFPDVGVLLADGYSNTFEETRVRTEMETGAARQRRTMLTAPRLFTATYKMSAAEYGTYDRWLQDTAQGGAAEFDIRLLDDTESLTWYTVRLQGLPQAEVVGENANEWRVTLKLRSKDAPFAVRAPGTNQLRGLANLGVTGTGALRLGVRLRGLATLGVEGTGRLILGPLYSRSAPVIVGTGRLGRYFLRGISEIGVDGTGHLVTSAPGLGVGSSWTSRATSQSWRFTASSADGVKLMVTHAAGFIHTSTDSGVNWTSQTGSGSRGWNGGAASSADGVKLVAAVSGGFIYTSGDSGVTWTQRATSRSWTSLCSSSDGTKLAACDYGGNIWTSTDSGVNWTQRTGSGSRQWRAVVCSSDGTKLVASVDPGFIYTSTDSGVNWTQRATSSNWYGLATSSDGVKLVASAAGATEGISVSTDSGATWTVSTGAFQPWRCAYSSANGNTLIVGKASNKMHISTDSGATWADMSASPSLNWFSISGADNASNVVAVPQSGNIWTSP